MWYQRTWIECQTKFTQKINDGIITLKYVPSKQILADGFTKPLNGIDFIEWKGSFKYGIKVQFKKRRLS